jgi:phosphoribosylglycinamide formyltransferase-1
LNKVNILVLVSGTGTNLQALLDAERSGGLGAGTIVAVVSDTLDAPALGRATVAQVPAFTVLPDKTLPKSRRRQELSDQILIIAEKNHVKLIVLAGFLSILTGTLIDRYAGCIINLHPSLLPRFGGAGMYGRRVHEAVLAAGETESGCTVHSVDAGTDTGPILLQRKVSVLPDDTPETLADRIHCEEHKALVEAVALMVDRLGQR